MDGDALPGDDADRAGTRQGELRLRGDGVEVLPALRLRGRGDEEHGEPRVPALGRGRRVLLRRDDLSRRQLPEIPGPLDGGPYPAVRGRAARGEVDRAL